MEVYKQRILLVFGTRPEAIKMAPLVKEFQRHPEAFETQVCVTGQHRQMLDQVLHIFGIVPDYDLDIMKAGQDLYDITSRVLLGMRGVLEDARPDWVLVHGDTTTSTAAALAAFYKQIPVGHVEAGLRTGNILSPWPEEMNRQLTGRLASLDFAPTPLARENLLKENVPDERIVVTGNTVIDALHMAAGRLAEDSALQTATRNKLTAAGYDPARIETAAKVGTGNPATTSGNPAGRQMVLITGHRRENFGEGFRNICRAIKTLSERYPDVDFVYPMHLNPNVRGPIHELFGEDLSACGNLFFIEPLEYLEFIYLMQHCRLVLTDSGGVQEEAPGLGRPVLVMRDTTERPEAVQAGTVRLVGTSYEAIVGGVSTLLDDPAAWEQMSRAVNPYGDGQACPRIVEALRERGAKA